MMSLASAHASVPVVAGGALQALGRAPAIRPVPVPYAQRGTSTSLASSFVHQVVGGDRRRQQARRFTVKTQAIGFVNEGSDSRIERKAEGALRDIASLLVFQSAMTGPPANAFKKVLHALRNGKELDALTAYGELFSLLAAGGYPGWMDYVLDQIFLGNNPFAETAAQGTPPNQAFKLAAAADLDTLQRLCITETTLAKWVGDSSGGVHEGWLKASAAFKDSYRPSDAVREAAASVVAAVVAASGGAGLISAPVISAERAEWRKRLGERWKWSEGGVEDLVAYYRRAGIGAVAESSVLQWRDGKLAPSQAPHLATTLLSCHRDLFDAVNANTQRHMSALPAQHVMLHGQPGGGKSYLIWQAAAACFASGLRVVLVPKSELKSLGALAAQLAGNPRVRFIVVCEDLGVLPFQDVWAEMVQLLGSSAWPSNAVVYATALRQDGLRPGSTPTEAQSGGAALKALFGLRLEVPQLTRDEFLECVRELRSAAAAAAAAHHSAAEREGVLVAAVAAERESADDSASGGGQQLRSGSGAQFLPTATLDKAARATAEAWDGSDWMQGSIPDEDRMPVAWAIDRGCGLCVMSAVQYVEEELLAMAAAGRARN